MKKRSSTDPKLRNNVFERDGYRCRYCGTDKGPFHADHVYPVSKGGETSIDNLVTACARCNLQKHDTVGKWPHPPGYFDIVSRNNKMEHQNLIGRAVARGLMWFGVWVAFLPPLVFNTASNSGLGFGVDRNIFYICLIVGLLFFLSGYSMFIPRKR